MPSIRTTLPRTPRSGPRISASEGCCAPHVSRSRGTASGSSFGGVPTKRTTPESVPPSVTAISSYAASAGGADNARTAATTRRRLTRDLSEVGIEAVLDRQPEAAAVPEEPQREHDAERQPDGELRRRGPLGPRPQHEIAGN